MKTTNLYALYLVAKNLDIESFSKYESRLSGRGQIKTHRPHEVETLVEFVGLVCPNVSCRDLDGFAFAYEISQLGREFDLLKVTETKVLNIELKSQMTTTEKLKKQLKQNKHFLNHLQRKIMQFVFVKNQSRFYQLKDDDLIAVDADCVIDTIRNTNDAICDDLSKLFKASQFLVSPLNTPERFIKGEYFLTDSQEDIKSNMLARINSKRKDEFSFFSISGSAGTGKTLLLYDIAKQLAQDRRVLIVHCGMTCSGHNVINENIHNLSVIAVKELDDENILNTDIVLYDETHRIYPGQFNESVELIKQHHKVGIFSFDPKQFLSKSEDKAQIANQIKQLDNVVEYKLQNKIRTNKEMTAFIRHLMYLHDERAHENYDNVQILYANDYDQANHLIKYYSKNGYKYISFTLSSVNHCKYERLCTGSNTHEVIGQEFDNVVMAIDDTFYYSNDGYLTARDHPNPNYLFRQLLFQGVTRVRERLALIIINNPDVFKQIIDFVNKPQFGGK